MYPSENLIYAPAPALIELFPTVKRRSFGEKFKIKGKTFNLSSPHINKEKLLIVLFTFKEAQFSTLLLIKDIYSKKF